MDRTLVAVQPSSAVLPVVQPLSLASQSPNTVTSHAGLQQAGSPFTPPIQPGEGNPLAELQPRGGASPATEELQPDIETLPPMPTPVWRTLIVQRVFGVSYVLLISGGLVSATLVRAATQLCLGGLRCTHVFTALADSLYARPHCALILSALISSLRWQP